MTLKLDFTFGGGLNVYASNMRLRSEATVLAAKVAGDTVAQNTERAGQEDIAKGGRFGPRWQKAFRSRSRPTKDGVVVVSAMTGWAAYRQRPFQEGGELRGRPLIWIPFSGTDAEGVSLRKYPAPLLHVTSRAGLPLLISLEDHRAKYFGKTSITVRKRFHLDEICQAVGVTIDDEFETAYKGLAPNG